ncbi:hypothetical protein BS47DRAFT_996897 [Hydnum rufescens UP504]|uniref:Uncharacterized protein n=1 Tax=Hydnum rufescens UP504 TaxID=1448309 RepID=A0A9P6DYS6_9AGAM|nr:hypothetical protein BS47DRAFT_996897 [Hydnum rufescens UP504]
MFILASLATVVIAITPILGLDIHQGPAAHRRHHEISHRPRGDISKRFAGARATYYAVGLGACGQYNHPSDFIVALNQDQFGSGYPGPHCFESITITCNGKTAHATIMDECPGCPYAGLDLSEGLFSYFADPSVGVLACDWSYGTSGENPKPAPHSSSPPPPPPPKTTTSTRKYVPPTSLSSHTTSKTTSTTSHKTSHSTSSHSTISHSSTSTTALPSTMPPVVPPETTPDNLNALNLFVLNLGNLVALALGA